MAAQFFLIAWTSWFPLSEILTVLPSPLNLLEEFPGKQRPQRKHLLNLWIRARSTRIQWHEIPHCNALFSRQHSMTYNVLASSGRKWPSAISFNYFSGIVVGMYPWYGVMREYRIRSYVPLGSTQCCIFTEGANDGHGLLACNTCRAKTAPDSILGTLLLSSHQNLNSVDSSDIYCQDFDSYLGDSLRHCFISEKCQKVPNYSWQLNRKKLASYFTMCPDLPGLPYKQTPQQPASCLWAFCHWTNKTAFHTPRWSSPYIIRVLGIKHHLSYPRADSGEVTDDTMHDSCCPWTYNLVRHF